MLLPERRIAPRIPVELEVEMDWGSEILRGRATDLSELGMFVVMADPLWLGASCSARLHLNGEAVPVNVVVKRVKPLQGIGALFVEVTPEVQRKIAAYLDALPK